jgi:lipopolysaccharide export system permease protein
MKPFPKIHDVYVARALAGSVLLAWAVLVGMDFLISGMLGEIGDIGKGDYTFTTALIDMIYTVPRRAYQLFPTGAVIGTLMGLGQLAASSELTALRALGLSRRRLGLAVALALSILTGLMVINGETLGPWGQRKAESLKASAKSKDMIVAQYSGLWAREGNTFLNAQTGEELGQGSRHWLTLRDVRLYEFDDAGRLESIARAAGAEHHSGGWLLHNVRRTYFDARSVTQTEVMEEHWNSKLDDAALAASVTAPRYMPAKDLRSSIEYRHRNDLDASVYEESYWGRWFYPVNVLALCLAAIPFAFGSLRSGGLGRRLFIGIVFALGFWLLQTQVVRLAGVYKFDYRVAYLIPSAVMLGVSMVLFRRRSG